MSKKLDASKLTLNIKKDFSKPEETKPVSKIDEIVKSIHQPANEKEKNEATKRTTVDVPVSLHKRIAHHVLDKDLTIKEYFLNLAKKDLANQ